MNFKEGHLKLTDYINSNWVISLNLILPSEFVCGLPTTPLLSARRGRILLKDVVTLKA